MNVSKLFKFSVIFVLILLLVSPISALAQEPTAEPTEEPTAEATEEPTVEATEEPTVEATEEPTAEPTEEPTAEPTEEPTAEATEEPTAEPTEEPTAEPTEEPTAEPTEEPTAEPTEELQPELSDAEIEAAGALPGSSTTSILAVANIDSSPVTVGVELYPYPSGSSFQIGGSPTVPVGGVHFYRSSDITQDGQFGAVVQSSGAIAAAAVVQNTTAHVADAYPGVSGAALDTELFAPLIFNKHEAFGGAVFETVIYCQNAGSGDADVSATFYKTGETTAKGTISTTDSGQSGDHGGTQLSPGQIVVWDIAEMTRFQNFWPGGAGNFGYARINSSENIACVVQNDRLLSGGYLTAQYQAVPSTYAASSLTAPLVYNAHGFSSSSTKGTKWNTSITFVNPDTTTDADISVRYSTAGGYSHRCTTTVPAGGSMVWLNTQIGTGSGSSVGWTCSSGALNWSNNNSTYTIGSANITVTSGPDVLGFLNSNKYDPSLAGTVGYSSLAASPSSATANIVCPVNWNAGSATSNWVSGIQVVNVTDTGTDRDVNVTLKMVRADEDPTNSSNFRDFSYNNIGENDSRTLYFPNDGGLTNFEGVVFVTADTGDNPNAKIVAGSSSTNYGNSVNGAAFYDCVNY